MLEKYKVENLMISLENYEVVDVKDYLEDAVDRFLEYQLEDREFKFLVVQDEDRIVGILSLGDILRSLKKLTKSFGKHEIFETSSLSSYGSQSLTANVENDLEKGLSRQVEEIMLIDREKIYTDDSGITALDRLLENNVRILPVYDNSETIIGVIRDIDLLDCIVALWKDRR